MTRQSIVEFESVSKNFEGAHGVTAVRDATFKIKAGQTIAIMGPSGSGKSTILNLAAGLDSPTSGSIYVEGRDLSKLSDNQLTRLRRDKVGLIFQSFNLLSTLTALENVSLPLRLQGISKSDAKDRAKRMLDLVGLRDRSDHLPDEISGGERQRVAIARAMVAEPILLLADEPTGNLDSEAGEKVLRILKDLNSEFGTTVVLVTHDRSAADTCNRVFEIVDGIISEESNDRRPGASLTEAVGTE